MFYADYHTHSSFSTDSETPMEENIKAAIGLGMKEIAVTDHIDFDFPDPAWPFLFDYAPYRAEVEAFMAARFPFCWGWSWGYSAMSMAKSTSF